MPQGARPSGPAPAGNDLAALAVRAVLVEVLLPHAADLFEPRVVRASFRRGRRRVEVRPKQRPHRAEAVGAALQGGCKAEEGESGVAALFDEPGVLQKAQ